MSPEEYNAEVLKQLKKRGFSGKKPTVAETNKYRSLGYNPEEGADLCVADATHAAQPGSLPPIQPGNARRQAGDPSGEGSAVPPFQRARDGSMQRNDHMQPAKRGLFQTHSAEAGAKPLTLEQRIEIEQEARKKGLKGEERVKFMAEAEEVALRDVSGEKRDKSGKWSSGSQSSHGATARHEEGNGGGGPGDEEKAKKYFAKVNKLATQHDFSDFGTDSDYEEIDADRAKGLSEEEAFHNWAVKSGSDGIIPGMEGEPIHKHKQRKPAEHQEHSAAEHYAETCKWLQKANWQEMPTREEVKADFDLKLSAEASARTFVAVWQGQDTVKLVFGK